MCSQPKQRAVATATELRDRISLPPSAEDGITSVEAAVASRRSCRAYRATPLRLEEIGRLLWAAQGVSDERGRRTVPSAGALYPLVVYLVAARVDSLDAGIYRYLPDEHALVHTLAGDRRVALSRAALDQEAVRSAPAVIAVAAVYERTTVKYGERGVQYVHMEVGAAAENVYLQAEALDLGTVFIGAFDDGHVQEVLQLPASQQPLALLPTGRLPAPE